MRNFKESYACCKIFSFSKKTQSAQINESELLRRILYQENFFQLLDLFSEVLKVQWTWWRVRRNCSEERGTFFWSYRVIVLLRTMFYGQFPSLYSSQKFQNKTWSKKRSSNFSIHRKCLFWTFHESNILYMLSNHQTEMMDKKGGGVKISKN